MINDDIIGRGFRSEIPYLCEGELLCGNYIFLGILPSLVTFVFSLEFLCSLGVQIFMFYFTRFIVFEEISIVISQIRGFEGILHRYTRLSNKDFGNALRCCVAALLLELETWS